ncbi:MAG: VWA domain-containing protein, partial [Planctomycetota bacterium]
MIDLGSLRFARPEAFLLVPLVLLLLRQRLLTGGRLVSTLRVLTLIVGASVLAEPVIVAGIVGRDLIVVVDRSRSAGDLPLGRLKEIYELAQQSAEEGDRIGLVSFGRDAAIEVAPTQGRAYAPPSRTLDREGTNLGSAVRVGLAAIPEGRPGALLIVSDGEATEGNAVAAAIEAKQRGVRIDTIPIRREGLMDLAVEDLIPPGEVAAGETFLIPAFITAVSSATADFRLVRDGEVIATGTETFTPGRNPIVLRDRIDRPGVHRYRLELINVQDRVPENNIAQAAVRATGPPRILCVTPSGREDRLSRSLELSGVEVVVARAEEADLSLDVLDGFRAVVLENVPASDLHSGALDALGTYVAKLGGALLMTGGKASFARGGYRNSRVEDVLPVTLEVRKEQRRFAVAMSLVLDRSGSMGASAGGSRTKMDLANLGSVAAIDLLSAMDSVSVIAVDSSPHIIVPQQQVTDPGTLKGKTRSITSGGGGIYTATGVHAAAKQLAKAVQGAKHIVVFADAADAEEPGNLHTFVPSLVKAGTTLSVIALGSASDVDAKFLRDLAKWGDGRCVFVSKASELPRIFAEETIKALKSSTIEEPTPVVVLPGLDELGAGIPRP